MKNKIILPDYEHCILNIITSILKYYNVKTEHKSLECIDKILEKNKLEKEISKVKEFKKIVYEKQIMFNNNDKEYNISNFRWNGRAYIKKYKSRWIFCQK